MLLAMLPAKFVVPRALPARLEAWLNLSHREKASVFIIVSTRAITMNHDILAFNPALEHLRQTRKTKGGVLKTYQQAAAIGTVDEQ